MTLNIFVAVFRVCLLGAMSLVPSMAVVINNGIFNSSIDMGYKE